MSVVPARIFRRKPDDTGALPSYFDPLTDPRWLRADEAVHMRLDDPVLGLEFNGNAWALPWWMMKNHHVANLELDGRAVLVTLCEMCSSSGAFDPVIDGRRRMFRLAGLFNGTIMPTDCETGSLWTGFTGDSIEGPLQGTNLTRLPLLQGTWQEWIEMHPETLVPAGEGESRVGHGEGHSPGSPLVAPSFKHLLYSKSDRIPHHELVLEAKAGGVSRCYPLSVLNRHGPVLNDSLGEEEIAVFSRPGSWLASAYSRNLDGRCLSFRNDAGAIVDEQTGSHWSISGVSESGPLKESRLRYVSSGIEEFFIWAAFNPGADIFGSEHWHAGPAHDQWGLEVLPDMVSQMLKGRWWRRGMRALVTDCGDGVLAAWLAESGLEVIGIDPDERAIAKARAIFRGVPRLQFKVGNLGPKAGRADKFDAVVDMGVLSRLKLEKRVQFVENLAAVMRNEGHCMVLAPTAASALEDRARRLAKLFGPWFSSLDAKALPLPDFGSGAMIEGGMFRLTRR